MTLSSAAVLALAVMCAYSNSLFLPNPRRIIGAGDAKSVVAIAAVVVTNFLLWYLTEFDPLICLLAWLPAVAGIAVVWLLGFGRRGQR